MLFALKRILKIKIKEWWIRRGNRWKRKKKKKSWLSSKMRVKNEWVNSNDDGRITISISFFVLVWFL